MPAGQSPITQDPNAVQDGRTTRQRRLRPVVMVNTGEGKGKTTAAMGLALRAWHQGWSIGVFQFVKSAKWRIGEQAALEALDRVHRETGEVLGARDPKEASAPADERERPILDKAGSWSGTVLGVGCVASILHYLQHGSGDLLFHTIFLSLILSSLAEFAFQLWLFRRA